MRKLTLITLFIFLVHALAAQRVRVIVPAEAVVSGNAFQVQYVIEGPETIQNIQPPAFDSLQLVSGPHRYSGTAMVDGKMQPIENIAYTLLSTRTGTFYFTP